jgi:hypothetical protein
MADISICSKRQFCFFHPDVNNSEAMQKAMNSREHNKPLPGSFTVKALPLQAQSAPDWIVNTPLFALAEKDGDIFVVPVPGARVVAGSPDYIQGQTGAPIDEQTNQSNQQAPVTQTNPVEPADLSGMTKAQLVEHAAEVHGLELNPAASKSDLIAAVTDAQKGN